MTSLPLPLSFDPVATAVGRSGAALRAEHVSVVYRGSARPAIADISLEVPAGAFVAIIGPSGAGKSTFLRCLNRLQRPTGGKISIFGHDSDRLPLDELRGTVSMVFQRFNLVPRLNVLTNVLLGRLARKRGLRKWAGLFTARDREIALQALERVGLLSTALKDAQALSGGQQQRVAIARCLAQEARVILADEPVASLDPINSHKIIALLAQLREGGITVIANLHQVDLARQYFERIVGLNDGRLVFDSARDGPVDRQVLGRLYGHLPGRVTPC